MALALEDRMEILELMSRYDLAADDEDVEAMVADFAGDGVIEGFYSTGQGKEAMRRDLPAISEAEGTLKRHLALVEWAERFERRAFVSEDRVR